MTPDKDEKYEITDIAHPDNPKLHRIRALIDLTENIHVGDLGALSKPRTISTKRALHGLAKMPLPARIRTSAEMQYLRIPPWQGLRLCRKQRGYR
ncbi:hypothetical protein NIA69_01465 [Gemmiger formicilis]|nr:hypothetical protein [Gemmiger formicilis]